jgi:ATP-dependent RNA helicase DDX27
MGLLDISCAELHGNMTQKARLDSLALFEEKKTKFLLCTDVAARGLDIPVVECVVNFDMPLTVKQYIHRVGRTARAGLSGRSMSLVSETERGMAKQLATKVGFEGKLLQRRVPVEVVSRFWGKIESLERDIESILQEEHVEAELRRAEMEVQKAENLITHREEIMSRPAREWFQSKKEKNDTKKKARTGRKMEEAKEGEKMERRKEEMMMKASKRMFKRGELGKNSRGGKEQRGRGGRGRGGRGRGGRGQFRK